jgi:hypothetical protein
MKIRNGFVSNSSSSSFIIKTCCLSKEKKNLLLKANEVAELLVPFSAEPWNIDDCGDHVAFETSLDNFQMAQFLTNLGFTCEGFDQ